MTDTKATKRALEAGGMEYAGGWFDKAFAKRVKAQAAIYEPKKAAILAQPPKPRGRPRKAEVIEMELNRRLDEVVGNEARLRELEGASYALTKPERALLMKLLKARK